MTIAGSDQLTINAFEFDLVSRLRIVHGQSPFDLQAAHWTWRSIWIVDVAAFNTLVKITSETIRRHEEQFRPAPRNPLDIAAANSTRWTAALEIVPGKDDPRARPSTNNLCREPAAPLRAA